ncbi:hypothetical protein TRIUR3_18823 [Triticum urartu]|uniref:Uncharacterized protein n=1 Tax=Triticum urartu TaxID=4572 RepID=M8A929_TRIUA|nr:hypothetical protein TRIUR3_18823 [Triticum urartu]
MRRSRDWIADGLAPRPHIASKTEGTLTHFTATTSSLPSDLARASKLSSTASKMSTVTPAYLDQRLTAAKRCSREAAIAGTKAAAVATVAAAVPTLARRGIWML